MLLADIAVSAFCCLVVHVVMVIINHKSSQTASHKVLALVGRVYEFVRL